MRITNTSTSEYCLYDQLSEREFDTYSVSFAYPEDTTHTVLVSENFIKKGKHSTIKFALVAGVLSVSPSCQEVLAKNANFSAQEVSPNSVENYLRDIDNPIYSYLQHYDQKRNWNTKKDIITSIISFKFLQQNWDGYGAIPLEVESASNAIELISFLSQNSLDRLSDSYPNPNGTISFQWENECSEIISLEIGNNTFSYYVELNSLPPQFFSNVKVNPKEAEKLDRFIFAL